MDFRDYLNLARALAGGTTEAAWRSATSRAYYAAFHVARELFFDLGFRVPRADRAHGYLWLRLVNAGQSDVKHAGDQLNDLRRERNRADYDHLVKFTPASVASDVQLAEEIVQALDAAAIDPIRTQITDAKKIYERNVLKDVTWHPPPP